MFNDGDGVDVVGAVVIRINGVGEGVEKENVSPDVLIGVSDSTFRRL